MVFLASIAGVVNTHAQTLISQFDFNNNLSDNLSLSTCSLYNNAAISYSNGVLSYTAIGYPGGGILIDVPASAFTHTNYSIALEFSFGTIGSYRKIIDFINMTFDDGLYLNNDNLSFYPITTGTYTFAPNTLYTILLTRNGSTQVCDASVIVGGSLQSQFTFTDNSSLATFTTVGSNRRIHLFHDDSATNAEYSPTGCVSSVKIWNGLVTNACSIYSTVPSPTIILNSSTICAGNSIILNSTPSPSGGAISYSNGYTIHTFTSSGTFMTSSDLNLEYLIVAGGGGGSSGGGGAGGVLTGTNYPVASNQSVSITVGSGGTGAAGGASAGNPRSSSGGNSVLGTLTAVGGGGGGGNGSNPPLSGGSGGGGGYDQPSLSLAPGIALQGNAGGKSGFGGYGAGGGGGGAGSVGLNANILHIGGNGGNGLLSSISGATIYYGGGGGGGINDNNNTTTPGGGGMGGIGGGGTGSSMGYGSGAYFNGTSGTPGTGGGGGGTDPESSVSGNGGSGIVIIRYQTVSVASYTWSNGSNTPSISVSPSVTSIYSVAVTNTQGCIITSSNATISVNPNPTISVSSGSICAGYTYTMLPSGASTYTFSNGTAIVSPLITTSYSVTGTSAQGCVGTDTAVCNITVNITPTISVSSGSICTGNSYTLVTAGASSYTYSSGSAVVSPLNNTSYSVTGTSAQGCVGANMAVSNVTVTITPTITVNSGTICAGQIFTLTPIGANTYAYSSGSSTINPSSTTAYSVTGMSSAGCLSYNTAIALLTVNAVPSIAVNSGSICQGSTFVIIPTGASTYTVSGGSYTVSPLVNSTYSVSGTSSVGCMSAISALSNLTVNVTPSISVNSGSICINNSFIINPSGANSYTVSGSTFSVSPFVNTSYSVTGSSLAGCVSGNTAVANVTVYTRPVITVNSGSMCVGQIFTINPFGASTYTYSSGSSTVNPIINTSYSVTGTSTAGCLSINTAVASVTVNVVPGISVNSGTICSGQSFTILPSGASTYTITGNNFTVSPNSTSSYSVTGTSSAGCLSTVVAMSNLLVNITPTISVNSGSICQGSTFIITPSGANAYTISGNTFTVSPISNTSYGVIGSNTNGCVNNGSVLSNVLVSPSPTISVNSGSICSGVSFVMNPGGAVTYTFSSASATVTPNASNTYSVFGSSALGCISLTPAVSAVNVYATPIISVNNGTICQNSTFTMTPSGANTYTFSSGSSTVAPLSSSAYSVSGTSTAGCVSTIAAVSNVSVNNSPTLGVNSGTICEGSTFVIIPNGANTYTISGNNFSITPLVNTSYSVSGTGTNGCVNNTVAISSVSVYINPTVSAISGSICEGQNFTITPSGAITYTYSSGTAVVSPSASSNYTIVGSNVFGCISVTPAIMTVTVNTNPTITVISGSICFGQNFTINPSGAITYTFSGNNAVVSPTSTSVYTVNGTSAEGCSNIAIAISNVTVYALPNVSGAISNSVICSGNSVTVSGTGATTYTWNNGVDNGVAFSPSASTTYSVIGEDMNGCRNFASVGVTVNALPTLTVSSSNSLSCVREAVVILANGAHTFTWNNISMTNTLHVAPLSTTVYTVRGTDGNNCISIKTFTQQVSNCNNGITIIPYVTQVSCRGKDDASISVQAQVTFTNNQIIYLWAPSFLCPANNCHTLNDLKKGTYSVTLIISSTVTPTYMRNDTITHVFDILDENAPCDLTIYNGITANGDGVNDVFHVDNLQLETYKNNTVKIYNRWGQLVADIAGYNNTSKAWPMREELNPLQESTYFYVIDLGDGSKAIKGWLELIKN